MSPEDSTETGSQDRGEQSSFSEQVPSRGDGQQARFLSLHARYGSEVVTVMGSDGSLLYESGSVERMLGYRHAEEASARKDWIGYVHPEDRESLARAIEECIATPGESPPIEYRIQDASGQWRWLESRGVNLFDDPDVGGLVVSTYEITARKSAEEAQQESEARLLSAFEDAPMGVAVLDLEDNILAANPALCALLGYPRRELVGKSSLEITHPDDRAESEARSQRLISGARREEGLEKRYLLKGGGELWAYCHAQLACGERGEPEHFVCHIQDIAQRKALEERLAHQALHDTLTGLPGRELLTGRLEGALARSRRDEGSVAVLFVDVDNLKLVNDSLGHVAGDRLLCSIGEHLSECVREEDTVARFGGDEFIVLLERPNSEEDALLVAGRILERLKEPLRINDYEVPITVSVGICAGTYPREDSSGSFSKGESEVQSAEDLIRYADTAMYRAKSSGGGGYAVFDPDMGRNELERLELSSDLHRAIERGELRTHYQHKIDLASGGVAGWEALLRWEHPTRGRIEPETFIPLAEDTGLIVPIGKWVLEQACEQARIWRERHPKEPGQFMSVNLSAKQFADPGLEEEIERILERTGLPASALDLEITERVLLEEEVSDFARIRKLKELGFSFSLDDFGTGYSSLLSLKQLPVDFIKVDRAFIERVPGSEEDEAFVTAMVGLARALGLSVVAEGIETAEQWRRLVELGCDYGQGYYFAPPLEVEEASQTMARLEEARKEAEPGT